MVSPPLIALSQKENREGKRENYDYYKSTDSYRVSLLCSSLKMSHVNRHSGGHGITIHAGLKEKMAVRAT